MKKEIIYLLLMLFWSESSIFAIDEIRFESGQVENDVRLQYKVEILEEAMKHTIEEYGDYRIWLDAPIMNNVRALEEIKKGRIINTFMALTNEQWEESTIPIKIPVRKGILNYRLLLINKKDIEIFSKVKSAEDLKRLKPGLKTDWTINKIMHKLNFDIVEISEYEGLFYMLDRGRFDFIPRGINEIYGEYEQNKTEFSNLIVEPNLVVVIPSPTYIFVSPEYPQLAERIRLGLERMIKNNKFNEIFDRHYKDFIKKADLKHRHLIDLGNPLLPDGVPFDQAELWVDLFKY